jgi:hypothetical protein
MHLGGVLALSVTLHKRDKSAGLFPALCGTLINCLDSLLSGRSL